MSSGPSIAATILCAGLGTRLGGRPKVALEWQGVSLLERLCGALRGAGVQDIGMVIGPYAEVLRPLAARCGIQAIPHGHHAPTLVDSQRLAIHRHVHCLPGSDLLLLPGDLPLMHADAVTALLAAWQSRSNGPVPVDLLRPVVQDTPGHPLAVSAKALEEIDRLPASQGVRAWMDAWPGRCAAHSSQDPAYVADLDTPADLARFCHALCGRKSPGPA